MFQDRYSGTAGEALRRQDEKRWDAANRVDAEAARQDLITRLPPGRALDHQHLLLMIDEATTRSWAILMRKRLLAHVLENVPGGILITRDELERLRADSVEHPKRGGPCPDIREWPSTG